MKKIGFACLFFVAVFMVKFSFENLDGYSFFLKMGCNKEFKEYSVFVETGCKPLPVARPPSLNLPSHLPEESTVKGFKLNHFEETVHKNMAVFEKEAECTPTPSEEESLASKEIVNRFGGFEKEESHFESVCEEWAAVEVETVVSQEPMSEQWIEFVVEAGNELEVDAGGFGEIKTVVSQEPMSEQWIEFVVEAGSELEVDAGGFGELKTVVGQEPMGEQWIEFVVEAGSELEVDAGGFEEVDAVASFEPIKEEWSTEFVVERGIELEAITEGFGREEMKDPIASDDSAPKSIPISEEQPIGFVELEEKKEPVATAETPKEVAPTSSTPLDIRLLLGLDFLSASKPTSVEPVASVEQVSEESYYYPTSYSFIKRVDVRHIVGNQENSCIPFATNYTTLDIFTAPDYHPGRIFPFLDLRGHRFDNNTYAANVGIGGRYVPSGYSSFCEMLGFNVYYDYRQGCVGYYQQIGAGIEVLGRRWDFRANGYAPFGARRHIKTCFFNDYEGDYFVKRRDIESVSYSFNGEIGYLAVNGKAFSLYMAAGPYFLARGRCCTSTVGVEARIRPKFKDYVALDLSARYDDLFGTIWQAGIIFSLPLYQISDQNQRPCGLRDWQIYQSVERFEVMPLSKRSCWETNY